MGSPSVLSWLMGSRNSAEGTSPSLSHSHWFWSLVLKLSPSPQPCLPPGGGEKRLTTLVSVSMEDQAGYLQGKEEMLISI